MSNWVNKLKILKNNILTYTGEINILYNKYIKGKYNRVNYLILSNNFPFSNHGVMYKNEITEREDGVTINSKYFLRNVNMTRNYYGNKSTLILYENEKYRKYVWTGFSKGVVFIRFWKKEATGNDDQEITIKINGEETVIRNAPGAGAYVPQPIYFQHNLNSTEIGAENAKGNIGGVSIFYLAYFKNKQVNTLNSVVLMAEI